METRSWTFLRADEEETLAFVTICSTAFDFVENLSEARIFSSSASCVLSSCSSACRRKTALPAAVYLLGSSSLLLCTMAPAVAFELALDLELEVLVVVLDFAVTNGGRPAATEVVVGAG